MAPTAAPRPLRLGSPPGLPAQVYPAGGGPSRATDVVVVWLHGGRFTEGSLTATQDRCALLAEAGADVVALAYPLAPAHAFPAALQAVYGALQAVAARPAAWAGRAQAALAATAPRAIVIGGEDAGGNLAAAVAMMARDQQGPALAGQLLLSPMLDPRLGSASMRRGACGGRGCVYAQGWKAYLGDGIHADHPYASPLHAQRLGGLPPALILSSAGHPLADESQRYALALRAQGVEARTLMLQGLTRDEALAPVQAFLRESAQRARALPG